MLRVTLLLSIALAVHAQDNPVIAQFQWLMGEPRNLASTLVSLPWKSDPPTEIAGLRKVARTQTLRIVSVEKPAPAVSGWQRWESEDGAAWVDVITFADSDAAAQALRAARQPHSGYIFDNQLLLFSGTGDRRKEAVGVAIVNGAGMLLNVGLKLPLEVRWDRPMPEADRTAFDAALTRFQSLFESAARAILDPAYANLDSRIEPRPDVLPALRMAASQHSRRKAQDLSQVGESLRGHFMWCLAQTRA